VFQACWRKTVIPHGVAWNQLSVDVQSLGMITAIRPDIQQLALGNPALLDAFIKF
jgi:hypothetical protein